MARIVVLGAGLCGLSVAIMLAKDGHHLVVLERDPMPPPGSAEAAWGRWERRGVNQFRMIHMFAPRWRQIIDQELPEVAAALGEAGGLRMNPLLAAPSEMTGGWREDDANFTVLTGRRPVVEAAVAETAALTPGLEIRRGVAVAGLRSEAGVGGIPHVIGVRTTAGEDLDADLVVDATGRRSPLPSWLATIGARPGIEDMDDSGFVYYARHFRSSDGSIPPLLGGVLQHYESVSTVTLPADNGTWGVGVAISAADSALRRLSDTDIWMRVVGSYPLLAHWIDAEALDEGPAAMAKLEDRRRTFSVDGVPVATGVVALGDSWACTNPSQGRGASIGLLHAQALRDHVRAMPLADPETFARTWEEITNAVVGGWYVDTQAFDRHRLAEIDHQIAGLTYRPEGPYWSMVRSMEKAAFLDPEALRGFLRVLTVQQTSAEVFAEPELRHTIMTKGEGWENDTAPGPSRSELLAIVGG